MFAVRHRVQAFLRAKILGLAQHARIGNQRLGIAHCLADVFFKADGKEADLVHGDGKSRVILVPDEVHALEFEWYAPDLEINHHLLLPVSPFAPVTGVGHA